MVLTIARDGSVYIEGGRIVVSVLEIRKDRVRLGFVADKEISIDRAEVYRKKQAEKADGADASAA